MTDCIVVVTARLKDTVRVGLVLEEPCLCSDEPWLKVVSPVDDTEVIY